MIAVPQRAGLAAFLASALLSVVAALAMPSMLGIRVIADAGYWIISCVAILWITCAVACLAGRRFVWSTAWLKARDVRIGVALVIVCTGFLATREPFGFKVTMDELVLGGTAMGMHYERSAEVFSVGYEINGVWTMVQGYLDKRPLFFPWMLSGVHDLLGYRMGNVHVLNVGISLMLFGTLFALVRRLHGTRAAVLALILLTSVPLMAQNVTGAGFEVLNAALIVGALLLALRFLDNPDVHSQGLFLATILLLAHTRYESVLYVFFAGGVVIADWILRRRVLISGALIAAPIALIPIPWHLKVFQENPGFWQLPKHLERPFGPEFLPDNLGHLMNFIVSVEPESSNGHMLGLVCLIAIPLTLVSCLGKWLRRERLRSIEIAFPLFLACVLANLTILLGYHWGQVDKFEVSRLVIPVYVAGAICGASVIVQISQSRRFFAGVIIVTALLSLAFSTPATSNQVYTASNFFARRIEWSLAFEKSLPPGEYLFISNSNLAHILNKTSAIPFWRATWRAEEVKYHLENRSFNGIFVVQNILTDPVSSNETIDPSTRLPPAFVLERVTERAFRPHIITRISRVVEVREVDSSAAAIPEDKPQEELSAEEGTHDNGWLLQQWGQRLP